MAHPFAASGAVDLNTGAERAGHDDGLSDLFEPLLAGARARGMADAFEMLGLSSVLIDATGRVLHAGSRAHRALSPLVRITEEHLVGCDPTVNDALQQLISSAVGGSTPASDGAAVSICDRDGTARLSIRAVRLAEGSVNGPQLLKAVLIVTETSG